MNLARHARFALVLVSAAAVTSAFSPAARGGLFASFAAHEVINAERYASTPPPLVSTRLDLEPATLPVHQTIAASSGSGSFAVSGSSTYDVTDDGTTAVYRMASQGQVTGPGVLDAQSSSIGAGLSDSTATRFVLSAPATFVATLTATGPITTTAYANLSGFAGLNARSVFTVDPAFGPTVSGTLAAGPYTIFDDFAMDNVLIGGPTGNGSGTYAFTLTLTAVPVPEPATAGVLAVAAAAAGLLGRRRR